MVEAEGAGAGEAAGAGAGEVVTCAILENAIVQSKDKWGES
jgi:hypothetical protein